MKKIFLFVTLALCLQLSAQNTKSWTNYSFGDYCSLNIPNTLELRDVSSVTGKFIDKAMSRYILKFGGSTPISKVVFQPLGMNSDDPKVIHEASLKYARVIIKLTQWEGVTQSDIENATSFEIQQLNDIIYETYLENASMAMFEIVQWFPIERIKHDNKTTIVMHYRRSSMQGIVDVKEYFFFIGEQVISITTSYRESEKNIWASDFNKIISTIKFK